MAEYFLEPNGQIHADLAFRLGKIIEQYDSINKSDLFNFDSSLCLCVLQNLLTIYDEKNNFKDYPLTREMEIYKKDRKIQFKNYFDISIDMIEVDNCNAVSTVGDFLKTLRNSMSHPTAINLKSDHPSTGYYSNSDKKKINSYTFINSPDVIKENTRFFYNEKDFNKFTARYKDHDFKIKKVGLKYYITNPRLTIINLKVKELKEITLKLSKLLSQPVQKNWDGLTFNDNILNIDYAA